MGSPASSRRRSRGQRARAPRASRWAGWPWQFALCLRRRHRPARNARALGRPDQDGRTQRPVALRPRTRRMDEAGGRRRQGRDFIQRRAPLRPDAPSLLEAIGDRLYLFGGLTVLGAGWRPHLLNDLWSYDPVNGAWEMLEPNDYRGLRSPSHVDDTRPSVVGAAGYAALDDSLYVFGGWAGRIPERDSNTGGWSWFDMSIQLWSYDTASNLGPPRAGRGRLARLARQALLPGHDRQERQAIPLGRSRHRGQGPRVLQRPVGVRHVQLANGPSSRKPTPPTMADPCPGTAWGRPASAATGTCSAASAPRSATARSSTTSGGATSSPANGPASTPTTPRRTTRLRPVAPA